MPRRTVRLLLRVAGWLLTPLVLTTAAAIGSTIGLFAAPYFRSTLTSLIVTGLLALAAAIGGLILWLRLLREHPQFRHTLDLAADGSSDSPLMQRLIHPDGVEPGGPA
jgi:hypothetical protein